MEAPASPPSLFRSAADVFLSDGGAFPVLPTGDAHLDALLGGGLPLRGLCELSGEAGSGKTQLVMQLALQSCARRGGRVLIINTEGIFPAQRLAQMAGGGGGGGAALVERVLLTDVGDAAALEIYLEGLPLFAKRNDVRLVVVDSIAAPMRGEFGGGADAPERSRLLFALAAALLRVNAGGGVGVVAVNQVSDVVMEGEGGGGGGGGALAAAAAAGVRAVPRLAAALSGGRWVRPALGLSWDSCVTHRLVLVKGPGEGQRHAVLLSSPALPPAWAPFVLTERGCVGTGPPAPLADLPAPAAEDE
jgi:hypothetical protein